MVARRPGRSLASPLDQNSRVRYTRFNSWYSRQVWGLLSWTTQLLWSTMLLHPGGQRAAAVSLGPSVEEGAGRGKSSAETGTGERSRLGRRVAEYADANLGSLRQYLWYFLKNTQWTHTKLTNRYPVTIRYTKR